MYRVDKKNKIKNTSINLINVESFRIGLKIWDITNRTRASSSGITRNACSIRREIISPVELQNKGWNKRHSENEII